MNEICSFSGFDNKRVLFFSETPYQMINCINMASHMGDFNSLCDLYVNDMYANSKSVTNKIKKLGLFNITKNYSVAFNKGIKAYKFLNLEKYISEVFGKFDYDIVFFASRDLLVRCVITYCKYIKKSTLLFSYDEGLGSYIPRMEEYTNSVEKLVIKMRYHDSSPDIITDKVLYKPEAYIGEANNIKLYKMPMMTKTVIGRINEVFNYSAEKTITGKYIYFDNYFDGSNEINKKVMASFLRKTNGKLVVKKHPRTPDGAYSGIIEYPYPNLPYEVIAANDTDIHNKVLITDMSSAVWTPMMLFDKYPRIILLYKIFNRTVAKNIIEKLISFYDKDKVLVINDLDELEKLELE